MKNESVRELLETGEIQMTDNVRFMLETVICMFQRGMESESGGQFIGFAMTLLNTWHESLETNSGKLSGVDEVIANIMTSKL